MLRFFRKYILNKIFLAVVGVVLMVVFLMGDTLNQMVGGTGDFPVGTVEGEELYESQLRQAAGELNLLMTLNQPVQVMTEQLTGGDELRYSLMLRDARDLGLGASSAEVGGLIQTLGLGPREFAQIRQRTGATEQHVRHVLRNFLILQQYRELVSGLTHMPVLDRLQMTTTALQALQQGDQFTFSSALAIEQGSPRLSEPLLSYYLQEQNATVSGAVLPVPARQYLDQVAEPGDAELQDLFEQYHGNLPGESEPFGFGYRSPERIQLVYMGFSIQPAMQQVNVTYADAIEFFEQNRERYAQQAPGQEPPSFEDISEQVLQDVRRRRAYELVQQMVRSARAMIFEQERRLPEQGGYRQIPADYQPLSMREVADRIEQEFGVRPQVYAEHQDDWVPVDELRDLPEIGQAVLESNTRVSFPQYVHSAMELSAADDERAQALRPLGLQTGIVSQPMVRFDGSMYLFRLTDARPPSSPESLDEVREQVVRDAKLMKAYSLLTDDQDRLVSMAKEQGLDAVAQELGLSVNNLPPTPRRAPNPLTGDLMVPSVVGVGRSAALVEQMFAVAESAAEAGSLEGVPAEQRLGSEAVPQELMLALFRIDQYNPISRTRFEAQARSPFLAPQISQTLLRLEDADPLGLDDVALRTGFIDSRQGADDDE